MIWGCCTPVLQVLEKKLHLLSIVGLTVLVIFFPPSVLRRTNQSKSMPKAVAALVAGLIFPLYMQSVIIRSHSIQC